MVLDGFGPPVPADAVGGAVGEGLQVGEVFPVADDHEAVAGGALGGDIAGLAVA